MKKQLVFIMAVICLALSSFAFSQGGNAPMANMAGKSKALGKNVKYYACEKCHMATTRTGKCPGCGKALQAINATAAFTCAACHTESAKPGNCPKCGNQMQMKVMTYACDKCHVTAKKAGKCPKCGMKMKKVMMTKVP